MCFLIDFCFILVEYMKMNKKYTILLFVLMAIHSLFAQTPIVDSLKKLSTANVNDTLKMHAYAELDV
jgi:hypothetical protein